MCPIYGAMTRTALSSTAGSRSISIKVKTIPSSSAAAIRLGTWTADAAAWPTEPCPGSARSSFHPTEQWELRGRLAGSRSTSSQQTRADYEDALLSITPKTWQDRIEATQHEEYLEWRKQVPEGPVPEDYANSPQDEPRKYFGAIAEDFEDAGLGQFVGYDEYGRPNALAYDRIGPALIPIIKRLRDRVDALETKLGETA